MISSLLFRGTKWSELEHERDIPSLSLTGRIESPCWTPPLPLQILLFASLTILFSAQGSQSRPFFSHNSRECTHRRRRHQVSYSSVVIDGNQVGKSSDDVLRCIDPKWSGIVAYRALIPTVRLQAFRDARPEASVRVLEANSIPIMVRYPPLQTEFRKFLMLPQYMGVGQNVVSFNRYLFFDLVTNFARTLWYIPVLAGYRIQNFGRAVTGHRTCRID